MYEEPADWPPPDNWVGRKELAAYMGVCIATIDRMVKAGMPSETWGLRVRKFRRDEAVEWARQRGRDG